MNERKAREIITDSLLASSVLSETMHEAYGYLEAIEKAKVLVKELKSIKCVCSGPDECCADLHERTAKVALEKYEKKK